MERQPHTAPPGPDMLHPVRTADLTAADRVLLEMTASPDSAGAASPVDVQLSPRSPWRYVLKKNPPERQPEPSEVITTAQQAAADTLRATDHPQ